MLKAWFNRALQFGPRAARMSTVGGAVSWLASTSSASADAAGADAAGADAAGADAAGEHAA